MTSLSRLEGYTEPWETNFDTPLLAKEEPLDLAVDAKSGRKDDEEVSTWRRY
jgi:hypothetical protein